MLRDVICPVYSNLIATQMFHLKLNINLGCESECPPLVLLYTQVRTTVPYVQPLPSSFLKDSVHLSTASVLNLMN